MNLLAPHEASPLARTSCLYEGVVVHRRHVHARHAKQGHLLRYKVFYLLLDLDELPALSRTSTLLGHNRRALFGVHDRDHGPGDGTPLRPWVDAQLAAAGIDLAGGTVRLMCFPRVLGYVFNPISVYFCYRADGDLVATLYEVGNTFGERHTYVIPANVTPAASGSGRAGPLDQGCEKKFYVSPFTPMESTYRFRVVPPADHVALSIRQSTPEGPLLDASFTGVRLPLSERALLRLALKFPLLTFKVIAGIHWEAFRLWRKGNPVFRHGAPPEAPVTIVGGSPP